MAQNNSASDPVTQAMLAIEDALNLNLEPEAISAPPDDPAAAPAPPPAPAAPATGPLAGTLKAPVATKSPDSPLLARAGAARPPEPPPALPPETPPANDDRAAAGAIVQALQIHRPSQAPIIAAAVLSGIWLLLCGVYGYYQYAALTAGTAVREALLRPETALFGLAALGPIIFVFAFAALARRLQELRLSASSIARVAMRLAEPETMAGEQFVTLSQAIRREVTSMGDGVERAYARASELEKLVRAEVASLERSSGEYERRLRTLIAEMADQRETILANGGQLRDAIGDAPTAVASDLEGIGVRITTQISQVGQRLATSLSASSEEIAMTMDRTGTATD